MRLVSLTPCPVALLHDHNHKVDEIFLPHNGTMVVVAERVQYHGSEDGLRFYSIEEGDVEIVVENEVGRENYFPLSERHKIIPMMKNTYYIVPMNVLRIAKQTDFISPFRSVRDNEGNVVGYHAFTKWHGG